MTMGSSRATVNRETLMSPSATSRLGAVWPRLSLPGGQWESSTRQLTGPHEPTVRRVRTATRLVRLRREVQPATDLRIGTVVRVVPA